MTLHGAIQHLHELRCAEDMPIYYKPVIAEVINVLLMDTEEVEHGHWVALNDDGRGYADEFGCTNCSCVVKYGYFTKGCDYERCPYCGAKMDEDKTETLEAWNLDGSPTRYITGQKDEVDNE